MTPHKSTREIKAVPPRWRFSEGEVYRLGNRNVVYVGRDNQEEHLFAEVISPDELHIHPVHDTNITNLKEEGLTTILTDKDEGFYFLDNTSSPGPAFQSRNVWDSPFKQLAEKIPPKAWGRQRT